VAGEVVGRGRKAEMASDWGDLMKRVLDWLWNNPYLLLTSSALFWGSNFVLGRVMVETIPPLHLSLFRWTIGLLALWPFARRQLKGAKALWREYRVPLFWMAMTGVVGFNALTYLAVQFTSSISASLFNSVAPVFIMLLSHFFLKEKIRPVQIAGVFISLIGVVWIVSRGDWKVLVSLEFNAGDLIMIVAVLSWAVYSILSKRFGTVAGEKGTFWILMAIGLPFSLLLGAVEEIFRPLPWSEVSPIEWLCVLYLGIFPAVVAFLCWSRGIQLVGPAKSGVFLHLIMPFAVMIALFFGETPTLAQGVGAAFVLLGVLMASNPPRKGGGRGQDSAP